ncbi:Death-associated inhibitor of apoptosis 2 [Astathelohania contejeani]|uniref:Death-associated inhibitor of apoptosis 2 n=1 Tax=Astathelohania contejeani TaxID=164912 RepID=A0ABQ7HX52_9MICR|nr:Death-associated inhibitor of apoptosis 2 [Thelohania contejeani]
MICIEGDLKYEQERLETFIDWPVTEPSPQELATNGFFYLKKKLHCVCAFCYVLVTSWDDVIVDNDDDFEIEIVTLSPNELHKKISPKCSFINGFPVGNIPREFSSFLIAPKYINYINNQLQYNPHKSLPKGIFYHKIPHHIKYSTYEMRLMSFNDSWPLIKQPNPQELAEAGFYYKPPFRGDEVACFHCNKQFRNWKNGQDPWVEHGRWSPLCYFILIMKGNNFIKNITPPSSLRYPPKDYGNEILKDMINKLDILISLSKSGLKREFIKNILKERLKLTRGIPFDSYDTASKAVEKSLRYGGKGNNVRDKFYKRDNEKKKIEKAVNIASLTHNLICNTFSENEEIVTLIRTTNESSTTYRFSNSKNEPILNFTIENMKQEQQQPQPLFVRSNQNNKLFSILCNVCQDRERCILILPCQHFCICEFCLLKLMYCPICRNIISMITRVYFS